MEGRPAALGDPVLAADDGASSLPPPPQACPPIRHNFATDSAFVIATAIFKMGQELRCPICLSLF